MHFAFTPISTSRLARLASKAKWASSEKPDFRDMRRRTRRSLERGGRIKHVTLQVPAQPPPSAPTLSARRAAPRSARSLFRRRSTANSSERATAGAAGATSITHDSGASRGKGYSQELTQPDTCSLKSGPRAKEKARTPSYIHDDTSRTRYGPRTVVTSTTEPF